MDGLRFDNSYVTLPEILFELRAPTPVKAPETLIWNTPLCERLGLDTNKVPVDILAGNVLASGSQPIAQAYAGHQFGHPNMLGDGRAVLLGEHLAPDGARFDIQLKGAGRTRYSRGGDGRAALGPMLREFIVSEAMAALGVPTTRSLAVVATGEHVLREAVLPGAVLVRVASSHLRVGTFQFAAAQDDPGVLRALADHALARHFPELLPGDYLGLLQGVCARQAALVADWMRVGFVHGVMNTDNMTISGETIDYGPCAFLESYGRDVVFSSIDAQGRYAFGAQPQIALWNLTRLAESLLPLLGDESERAREAATTVLQGFPTQFEAAWLAAMRGKLGLAAAEEGDMALVSDVLDWLEQAGTDYTNFWRGLADGLEGGVLPEAEWVKGWLARIGDRREAAALIRRSAPAVVPRNHVVEAALRAAEAGDLAPVRALLAALDEPYAETAANAAFRVPARPEEVVRETFCGT
ncbi:protein adenylyltransferase SelO [Polymorphobacter sp.]|uniref:protein adenylyltransferase SelO n=1 Tax=Polymorphobacter sp. TaxID=1909290 RepID=UPI003F6F836F